MPGCVLTQTSWLHRGVDALAHEFPAFTGIDFRPARGKPAARTDRGPVWIAIRPDR